MTARLFGLVIILTINCCNSGQTKELNKDMNQLTDSPNEKLIVAKGPKEEQMKKVLEGFAKCIIKWFDNNT